MIATVERSGSQAPGTTTRLEGVDRQSFVDEALPQLDMLYRYGRGLTGDPMYADDLVQEVVAIASATRDDVLDL